MTARRTGERGVLLALAGLWLAAIASMAAIALGVARLTDTATETQAVADAGALAGAGALLDGKDAYTGAQNVAQANQIDGRHATFASPDIVLGFYDTTSHRFVRGGSPTDAVEATAHATVSNLWAAMFGNATTPVTKRAVAAYTPLSANNPPLPSLPIAIGDCFFSAFQQGNQCSQLPQLIQVPDGADNSGWTSLESANGTPPTVTAILPSACGGGEPPPLVTTGENIGVLNGQATPILKAIQKCVANGVTQWVVPIVACGKGKFNQTMTVEGFATINIVSVNAQGGSKQITLSSICNTASPGPPTPDNFGSGEVALVQ